jgi:hypothetical protein
VTGPGSISDTNYAQVFCQARPWKRFVHVCINYLESVCVEQTIRRVRSDVAVVVSGLSLLIAC